MQCEYVELWAAVELSQVRFSTDGIVAEIEHAKAAQRQPEVLSRKCSDLGDISIKFYYN